MFIPLRHADAEARGERGGEVGDLVERHGGSAQILHILYAVQARAAQIDVAYRGMLQIDRLDARARKRHARQLRADGVKFVDRTVDELHVAPCGIAQIEIADVAVAHLHRMH